MLTDFLKSHQLANSFRDTAKEYFIPIAQQLIAQKKQKTAPLFVGVNGCQGSGKSTLSAFVCDYIKANTDLTVEVLSLDDFYYSASKRIALAETVHPLLKTRGVPGTHNTKQLSQVLAALKQGDIGIEIPRFNKATDNPHPSEKWTVTTQKIDIVLMEGWCWGVMPEEVSASLKEPVNTLEKEQDPSMVWRTYVDSQLAEHYVPLYAQMDKWIFLQAPSFDTVYHWRLEQEQKLKANTKEEDNHKVMSEAQLLDFIQYYQRLTQRSLLTMPDYAHYVFILNSQRNIVDLIQQSRVKLYA